MAATCVISTTNLVGDELSYGSGSDPAELTALLDASGGTEDSSELQLNVVVADLGVGGVSQYDNVQITIENDVDSGIDWRIAEDSGGSAGSYTDGPLAIGTISINSATPFWVKAVVDDDGSVSTNRYTSPKLALSYTATP